MHIDVWNITSVQKVAFWVDIVIYDLQFNLSQNLIVIMSALMLHSLCFPGRLVAECFWCELKVPVQWLVVFGWFGRLVCILSKGMRKGLQAPSPEEDL